MIIHKPLLYMNAFKTWLLDVVVSVMKKFIVSESLFVKAILFRLHSPLERKIQELIK